MRAVGEWWRSIYLNRTDKTLSFEDGFVAERHDGYFFTSFRSLRHPGSAALSLAARIA